MANVSVTDDFTPAELVEASKLVQYHRWLPFSTLECQIHNILSKQPKEPDDFNPYARKKHHNMERLSIKEAVHEMSKLGV